MSYFTSLLWQVTKQLKTVIPITVVRSTLFVRNEEEEEDVTKNSKEHVVDNFCKSLSKVFGEVSASSFSNNSYQSKSSSKWDTDWDR